MVDFEDSVGKLKEMKDEVEDLDNKIAQQSAINKSKMDSGENV
jgi:hypothetical protein